MEGEQRGVLSSNKPFLISPLAAVSGLGRRRRGSPTMTAGFAGDCRTGVGTGKIM